MNKNEWVWHYHYWSSHRNDQKEKVKLRKYLGLRGYNGYIMIKEHEGVRYAGEVWEAETKNGSIIRAVFRIPAEEAANGKQYQNPDLNVAATSEYRDLPNYHTDGIAAFESGDPGDIDRRKLNLEQEKLNTRISNLKEIFKIVIDADLKLGIQIYLRRLETPDYYTRKQYIEWKKKYPQLQKIVVDISYGEKELYL